MPTKVHRFAIFVLLSIALALSLLALISQWECIIDMDCITEPGNYVAPVLCVVLAVLILLRRIYIQLRSRNENES